MIPDTKHTDIPEGEVRHSSTKLSGSGFLILGGFIRTDKIGTIANDINIDITDNIKKPELSGRLIKNWPMPKAR